MVATPEGDIAVAIVGMAAVFPGAPDLETFWANVVDGVDAIGDVPPGRWDPVYFDPDHPGVDRFACRRGGFVDAEAVLDPAALGVVPSTVEVAEPDQLLSLALAAHALADAGGEALLARRHTTGVVVGRGGYLTPGLARLDQRVRTSEQLVTALRSLLPGLPEERLAEVKAAFVARLGPDRPDAAIDLVPNLAASRIANRLDLYGPAYTVDAACASALVAVDHAVRELASGRCDLVVAGGVHLCHDVTLWSVFTQLGALSTQQCIRPFDQRADGLLIGEGGGMLVLERLADAEANGSRVYAVIRGVGISSDGRSASLMRPGVEGQVLALERAWAESGIDPLRLGYLEAHGTATPTGDATEIETLHRFFGEPDDAHRGPSVGVGSVKSMIGHAMPAAGAAGLIKAALAVHHGVLPPSLHCEEPHQALSATRFSVVQDATPWPTHMTGPRVGAVNAFGFGGINAHVVLEQHGASGPSGPSSDRLLTAGRVRVTPGSSVPERDPVLLLEASSVSELLDALTDDVGRDTIDAASRGAAPAPATVGQGTVSSSPTRLALVDPTSERVALARKIVQRGAPWRGRNDVWFTDRGLVDGGGKVAFVFPGVEPSFEPKLDDVVAHLGLRAPPVVESDAAAVDLEGLGHAIVGVARVLDEAATAIGLRADCMAGQSIGEWCGMIASQMIPASEVDGFIDSIHPGSLVVPGVVFCALGCDVTVVEDAIASQADQASAPVTVSHDNCPHQTIVCGHEADVAALLEVLKARRVMGQVLPFRSGFHSAMFAPFLEPFRSALARLPLQPPTVPMWSATTCAPYPDDPDAVRALALAHLVERVRFRELSLTLYDVAGARVFVQVGVGSLVGLLEDTLSGRDFLAVASNTPRRSGLGQLARMAGACWVEGVRGLEFGRLAAGGAGRAAAAAPGRVRPLRALPLQTPLVRLEPIDLGDVAPSARSDTGRREVSGVRGAIGVELDALMAEVAAVTGEIAAVVQGMPPRPQPTSEPLAAPEVRIEAVPVEAAPADGVARTRLSLSVDSEPALLDHCFYRQPEGWPNVSDRFPVVPMTMLVDLMMEAANRLAPQLVPVAVQDVQALRWLAVAPPVDVDVTAEEMTGAANDDATGQPGNRRIRVSIDGYARCVVVLAPGYPQAPAPSARALTVTEDSPTDAQHLYADRWLFHGPRYQGVRRLGPIGPDGIDGIVELGDAPGAVLDNAGQLMGFWVMARQTKDRLALPMTIDRISFFGPRPPVGALLDVTVRIDRLDEQLVGADLELVSGDRLWAKAQRWTDRRFDSDEVVWPVLIWPERNVLSTDHPGGFVLVEERWRYSASRELMMRRYLGEEERHAYDRHHPRGQRLFLLGRIAVKDAARRWFWDHGGRNCHPVELMVENDSEGRPLLRGPFDADLRVSIAHTPWVGMAMVVEHGQPGVDVERVEARADGFAAAAFSPRELEQLFEGGAEHGGRVGRERQRPGAVAASDQHGEDPDGPRRAHDEQRHEWLTRGWAAKEAAAKAAGTGLRFAPRRFVISEVEGNAIMVDGQWVQTATYDGCVVAWTVRDGR